MTEGWSAKVGSYGETSPRGRVGSWGRSVTCMESVSRKLKPDITHAELFRRAKLAQNKIDEGKRIRRGSKGEDRMAEALVQHNTEMYRRGLPQISMRKMKDLVGNIYNEHAEDS